jgi:glucose dehydrogenase
MEKWTLVTRLLLMLLVLLLLLLLPSFKRRFVDRTASAASADRLSSIMMNVVVFALCCSVLWV